MQAGIDSVNVMLSERGIKTIDSIESYRDIFDFPIEEYYRRLGFDFERETYEVLAPIWVAEYNARVEEAKIVDGVAAALDTTKKLGITQVIISASEEGMLCRDLKRLGVYGCFDRVMGLDNIHAGSKEHIAQAFAKENPDARLLFVGDTTHDAQVARAVGADCLLFSGGHQSRERLEACGYPVIDSILEIVKYIN